MSLLTGNAIASLGTPEAFVVGQTPTTQVGFEKVAGQTGIFVFARDKYKIYFKNTAGQWVQHADITQVPVVNKGLTYPWGDYTAVCFAAINPKLEIHVHVKTSNILVDNTPNDPNDDDFTLFSPSGATSFQSDAYDLPDVDGMDGQMLTTDGAGSITWQHPFPIVGGEGFLELYLDGIEWKKRWASLPDPGAKFLSKVILQQDQEINYELRGQHNNSPNACRWTRVEFGSESGPTPGWNDNAGAHFYTIPENGWYEFSTTIQWMFKTMHEDTWFDLVIASSHPDGASSPTQLRKLTEEKWKPYQVVINRIHMYPLASTRFLQKPIWDDVIDTTHSDIGGAIHNSRTTNLTATSYCEAGERISVYVRQGHKPHHVAGWDPNWIVGHTNHVGALADYFRGVESNLIIKKL